MDFLSLNQLRAMSVEDLEKAYDAKSTSTVVGLNFIREEINRRENEITSRNIENLTVEMRDMTKSMKSMTAFVILLTILNIVIAAIPLIK